METLVDNPPYNYDAFQQAIISSAVKNAERKLVDVDEKTKEDLAEAWFMRRPHSAVSTRKPSRSDEPIVRVFFAFNEIADTWEALLDIEVYIGRFPYSKTRITKERFLYFIIRAYFSELYILRERLLSFIKIVERTLVRKKACPKYYAALRELEHIVNRTLNSVLNTRHTDTHEQRLQLDELERLNSVSLLVDLHDDARFAGVAKLLYRIDYRKVRREWKATIKSNNIALKKLLDVYFSELYPIVMNSERMPQPVS